MVVREILPPLSGHIGKFSYLKSITGYKDKSRIWLQVACAAVVILKGQEAKNKRGDTERPRSKEEIKTASIFPD